MRLSEVVRLKSIGKSDMTLPDPHAINGDDRCTLDMAMLARRWAEKLRKLPAAEQAAIMEVLIELES